MIAALLVVALPHGRAEALRYEGPDLRPFPRVAPASVGLVAYTDKGGKVMVMDQGGKTKEVGGTSDALLPAWSDDGTKLAFLKKDGRKKFAVHVADVTR